MTTTRKQRMTAAIAEGSAPVPEERRKAMAKQKAFPPSPRQRQSLGALQILQGYVAHPVKWRDRPCRVLDVMMRFSWSEVYAAQMISIVVGAKKIKIDSATLDESGRITQETLISGDPNALVITREEAEKVHR